MHLLANRPDRIIGVTGHCGKSTTAAMIAAILRASGRSAWLGIDGRDLDAELPKMHDDDWIVLELSDRQIEAFASETPAPHLVVATDGRLQRPAWQQRQVEPQPMGAIPALAVPGEHNRRNAALAAAAALAIGCAAADVRYGLEWFPGLPRRLQWMAVVDGRHFYNDAAARVPESTVAALQSLDGPLWLIAGGSDDRADWVPLVEAVAHRACGAAIFGEVRQRLLDGLRSADEDFFCTAVETMDEAFTWCLRHSRRDDTILFSPGCLDEHTGDDCRARGQRLVELARVFAAKRANESLEVLTR